MLSVPTADQVAKDLVQCGYVRAADLADRYGNSKQALDPDIDPMIVGPTGIFTQAEYDGDDEIRKTAAVMKMVVNGYAGAGNHRVGRLRLPHRRSLHGEMRDFRAGRLMGACLEYAARRQQPLMLYVFSDGSLSSNGMIDNTAAGRGKGVWTGDKPGHGSGLLPGFQPEGSDHGDPQSNWLLHRRWLGSEYRQSGRQCRELARRKWWCSTTWHCTAKRELSRACNGPRRAHRSGEPGHLSNLIGMPQIV